MKPTIYQTDEEDFKCMDLYEEGAVIYGTQSYNGESSTSDDVFQHVKGCKEKGKTWWWQCVRVVLVSFKGNYKVIYQLQCKCCDTFLSPSNACKTHLSMNCRKYRGGCEKWAHFCGGAASSSNKRQALGLSQQWWTT